MAAPPSRHPAGKISDENPVFNRILSIFAGLPLSWRQTANRIYVSRFLRFAPVFSIDSCMTAKIL